MSTWKKIGNCWHNLDRYAEIYVEEFTYELHKKKDYRIKANLVEDPEQSVFLDDLSFDSERKASCYLDEIMKF